MGRLFTIVFLLGASLWAAAQDSLPVRKKISARKQNKLAAKKQINQLSGGALLVILKTQKPKIAALKKAKYFKLAEQTEKEQRAFNKEAVAAFKEEFYFCPVYFFMSDYGPAVYDKNFGSVVFVNDSLLPDSSIKFSGGDFFMAEFGTIEQDTIKHASGTYYAPNKAGSLEKRLTYYGGADFKFGALLIKSDLFIQLRRPFPYYSRTFDLLPVYWPLSKVVKKMNEKLVTFYFKNTKRKAADKLYP